MGLVKTIFFVVGRLATAILCVLGFAFSLTGESVLTLSPNNWGIIGIIAFGVFFVSTVAREIDLALEQKPNIIVSPEIHDDRATLVITNTGGEANFTAKARVRATIPEPALYTMCWESVPATNCHIDGGGGTASILVAEKAKFDHMTGDVSTSFFKGYLILFKRGTVGGEAFPAFSGETSKKIIDGKEIISGTSMERCIVEITITAAPTPRKRWGTRKYLCEIENEQIKLCETELSVPDKSI